MKRVVSLFITVLMIGGARVMWAAENFTSENIAGKYEISIPADEYFVMMTVGLEAIGGANPTLLDIFGINQLEQDLLLVKCDLISIFNPITSTYQNYAQYTDGKFYPANNATEWQEAREMNQDVNPVLLPGHGFWLLARNVGARTITITGQVVSDPTIGLNLLEGFQMSGNPFSAELEISDIDDGIVSSNIVGACDRITVWDPVEKKYQTYAQWTNGNWYKANNAREWVNSINAATPEDFAFGLGTGFWFVSQNERTMQITRPYGID